MIAGGGAGWCIAKGSLECKGCGRIAQLALSPDPNIEFTEKNGEPYIVGHNYGKGDSLVYNYGVCPSCGSCDFVALKNTYVSEGGGGGGYKSRYKWMLWQTAGVVQKYFPILI